MYSFSLRNASCQIEYAICMGLWLVTWQCVIGQTNGNGEQIETIYEENFEDNYPSPRWNMKNRARWLFDLQRANRSPYFDYYESRICEVAGNHFVQSGAKDRYFWIHDPRSDGGAFCQLAIITFCETDIKPCKPNEVSVNNNGTLDDGSRLEAPLDLENAWVRARFRMSEFHGNWKEHWKLHVFVMGTASNTHGSTGDKSSQSKYVTYVMTGKDLFGNRSSTEDWCEFSVKLEPDLNNWTAIGHDWRDQRNYYGFCPDVESFRDLLKKRVCYFGIVGFYKRENADTDFSKYIVDDTNPFAPRGLFDLDDIKIEKDTTHSVDTSK